MPETTTLTSKEQKIDLLLISQRSALDSRVQLFADSFSYSHTKVETPDQAGESLEGATINFIILDASQAQNQNDVVGYLQVLRYSFPKPPVLVVFPKQFDKKTLPWIRKSGANFIMSEGEFYDLARFDFFACQSIGREYVPVKFGDFKLDSKIEFPLFYFMSANRRYFPIVTAHSLLDQSRLDKLKKIGDVQVRRVDLPLYHKYLETNQDQSANGLMRRCRLQFNQFRESYWKLVNHLTEDAEASSYDEGKKILEECQRLSSDLVTAMMSAGSVFDVISHASEGDLNFTDRSPERASIVGYLCLMADVGNSETAILAALLADIGLLNLPTNCLCAIRKGGVAGLNEHDRDLYQQHPQLSINCVAQKKIQLEQVVRDTILYSHAQLSGRGFPEVRPEKIGVEAQLVHFVQRLDDACKIQAGKPKVEYMDEFKRQIASPEIFGILSPAVVKALKGI